MPALPVALRVPQAAVLAARQLAHAEEGPTISLCYIITYLTYS